MRGRLNNNLFKLLVVSKNFDSLHSKQSQVYRLATLLTLIEHVTAGTLASPFGFRHGEAQLRTTAIFLGTRR